MSATDAGSGSFLDRYFGLTQHGTTVRTEVIAGVTTFLVGETHLDLTHDLTFFVICAS